MCKTCIGNSQKSWAALLLTKKRPEFYANPPLSAQALYLHVFG